MTDTGYISLSMNKPTDSRKPIVVSLYIDRPGTDGLAIEFTERQFVALLAGSVLPLPMDSAQ